MITVNEKLGTVTANGKETDLSPKELLVLLYLMKHTDIWITAEMLRVNCWNDNLMDESGIRFIIWSLRKILGKEMIKSRRGYGYRFNDVS